MDAEPVGHGGDGAERPATAAATLVADLLDAGALRPLAARVELGGDLQQVSLASLSSQKVRLPQRRHELLVHWVDAEQGLLSERGELATYHFTHLNKHTLM